MNWINGALCGAKQKAKLVYFIKYLQNLKSYINFECKFEFYNKFGVKKQLFLIFYNLSIVYSQTQTFPTDIPF